MSEGEFEDLKGLEWQVNINHRELYYVGRGGTLVWPWLTW